MNGDPWFLINALRTIFSALDNFGYFILDAVYDIFFTVANSNVFQGTVINTFYSRVQLILGVFMIFKLSITLLQMIVNPDMYKDKQKGAGSLVKRIAIILVLLTLIVPITLDEGAIDGNPLNEQIASNGILFGFLYQIQNTVIEDNVLGKLVLGSNVDSTSSQTDSNGTELSGMADVGAQLAATVAKAFIKPTLSSTADDDTITSENEYETNVACESEAAPYFNSRLTAGTLIDHINDTCKPDSGSEVYVFDYTLLGGLFCSIIMIIIILGFTIDVAVRAVKLAILRLIAPIPIISYLDPGQEKNGAFGNWVKTLTSTYISLFVRLIVIYFGAYLIILLTDGNDDFSFLQSSTSVFTSAFATIFVIIGILMFMKEAPKFFQDMFGLKGDGKLFSGIGTILGAAALTGGLAGSAYGSFRTGMSEGKELGLGTGRSIWRGVRAGTGGLLGGAFVGTKALATADKKAPSAVMAAMQKRNAMRATGSTLFGRIGSNASAMFMGSSLGGKAASLADLYDKAASAAKAHKQMLEDEALKDMEVTGTYDEVSGISADGRAVSLSGNYQDIVNRMQQARAQGSNDVVLANGDMFSMDDINSNVLEKLKESQTRNYAASAKARSNAKVQGTAKELEYAFRRADLKVDPYVYSSDDRKDKTNVKRAIGEAMNAARDIKADPKTQWKIANDKATNNNNK